MNVSEIPPSWHGVLQSQTKLLRHSQMVWSLLPLSPISMLLIKKVTHLASEVRFTTCRSAFIFNYVRVNFDGKISQIWLFSNDVF